MGLMRKNCIGVPRCPPFAWCFLFVASRILTLRQCIAEDWFSKCVLAAIHCKHAPRSSGSMLLVYVGTPAFLICECLSRLPGLLSLPERCPTTPSLRHQVGTSLNAAPPAVRCTSVTEWRRVCRCFAPSHRHRQLRSCVVTRTKLQNQNNHKQASIPDIMPVHSSHHCSI